MKKDDGSISMNVVRRLPKYHRFLRELKASSVVKISSKELSEITGFTASQIRQDLNTFGGFGKQGYGYDVNKLYKQISKILGLNVRHKSIIVGAGHLGQAIANYSGFREYFLDMKGIFDIDHDVIGRKVNDMTVMDENYIKAFIEENSITVAIICTPRSVAADLAEKLIDYGIKGIWNFAPVNLEERDGVSIENVSLAESLYVLSFLMNKNE